MSILLRTKPSLKIKSGNDIESRRIWLEEELGLRFDPFSHLDAGNDPQLSSYLIDHEAFPALWGDWPSFLFAPIGGGKTAFRVRLARACRVRQDNQRIFPVIFRPPRPPGSRKSPKESYFEALLSEMAAALLLELAYRPDQFLQLNTPRQEKIRFFLEQKLPGPLNYYLAQLEDSGSLEPLTRVFDPTAKGLPGEPLSERIRSFCERMRKIQTESNFSSGNPVTQIEQITDLLKESFAYKAVYLLVDGVDAYVQKPSSVVQLLDPLLARTRTWERSSFFVKYFLPKEFLPKMEESYQSLLTSPSKMTIIKWDVDSLVEVVQERLRAASEGMFDSLTAISRPDVSRQIERHLAEVVSPVIPREIIRLSQRVFTEHIERVGPYGRLEQRDFDAALAWYPGL